MSEKKEPTKFSTVVSQDSVVIADAEGVERTYAIKEMTGRQLEVYLNSSRNKVIMENGQVVGMKDFEGLYSSLLSTTLCDESDKLVSKEVLQNWPASTQRQLFQIAQKLNGLGESEEEVKND